MGGDGVGQTTKEMNRQNMGFLGLWKYAAIIMMNVCYNTYWEAAETFIWQWQCKVKGQALETDWVQIPAWPLSRTVTVSKLSEPPWASPSSFVQQQWEDYLRWISLSHLCNRSVEEVLKLFLFCRRGNWQWVSTGRPDHTEVTWLGATEMPSQGISFRAHCATLCGPGYRVFQ